MSKCDHDPDDGGNTCCTCGKVMTAEDRRAYEMKLRGRLLADLPKMEGRIHRDLDAFFAARNPTPEGK